MATPLDAERERLRAEGYTDAEISQILINRASGGGSQQSAPLPPIHGHMTGILGNASAVLSHARAAIPVVTSGIANLSDAAAPPKSRFKSAALLIGATVVVCVLGFAVWQEWQQHIVSATTTAANNAEITEAQKRKAKADADVAEQVAVGERAKACSARLKLITDNMTLGDMDNNGNIRPGSRLAQSMDLYNRDCDPTYAAHAADREKAIAENAKMCEEKFPAVTKAIEAIDINDKDPTATIKSKIEEYKQNCEFTPAQSDALKAALNTRNDKINKIRAVVSDLADLKKIETAYNSGDYATAYTIEQQYAARVEAEEIKTNGKTGKKTASTLGSLAWYALFAKKYPEALYAADRAIALDPTNLVPAGNRAHALMLVGRTAEAKALYLSHKGEKLMEHDWDYYVFEDFDKLRKAGISDPLMSDIEAALNRVIPQLPAPVPQPAIVPAPTPGPVQATQTPIAPAPVSAPVPAPTVQKVINAVSADQLTVRNDPDGSSTAVAVLNQGAQVEVDQLMNNGWAKIHLVDHGNYVGGYVNGKYLASNLNATIPVVISEPPDPPRPSFCGSESEAIEFIIYANPALAEQDGAMAKSYHALMSQIVDSAGLRTSQRAWINYRNINCGVPMGGRVVMRAVPLSMVYCLTAMTDARKHDLRMGRF